MSVSTDMMKVINYVVIKDVPLTFEPENVGAFSQQKHSAT
jgi:hypothetical protein